MMLINTLSDYKYGKVVDIKDPKGMSRVKVCILGEQKPVDDWFPVIVPFVDMKTVRNFVPGLDDLVVLIPVQEPGRIGGAVLSISWFLNAEIPDPYKKDMKNDT